MYYFDAHCDYLWKKLHGEKSGIEEAEKFKLKKSVLAVFEGNKPNKIDTEAQIQLFYRNRPVKNAYIAFEGLSLINDVDGAERLCKLRPLYVAPVWNNSNKLGGSCHDDMVITAFGKKILNVFSENKICIDAAHSGKKMFYSLLDNFDNVIFSHGNVKDICDNKRNLSKNQINELIKRNSFIGLALYPPFLGGNTVEKLFEHIEYILDLGGENILGFGSDIDGCDELLAGKSDASVFDMITEEFIKRNYSKALIEKITHKNLERFI